MPHDPDPRIDTGGAVEFVLKEVGVTVQALDGPREILREVSGSLPAGRCVQLVGPSGAGKTTLLRLLNRLDSPSTGQLLWRGEPIEQAEVRELRRRVVFLPQPAVMFPGSVLDNLVAAGTLPGRDPQRVESIAAERAEEVGLGSSCFGQDASGLSAGERRRVALCRTLAAEPETLLADEPLANLDDELAARVADLLARWQKEGNRTLVVVNHLSEPRELLGGEILRMERGRLLVDRSPRPAGAGGGPT